MLSESQKPIALLRVLAGILCIALFALLNLESYEYSYVAICAVLLLIITYALNNWGVASAYILVFGVFHFSAYLLFRANLVSDYEINRYLSFWMNGDLVDESVLVSGFCACVFIVLINPKARLMSRYDAIVVSAKTKSKLLWLLLFVSLLMITTITYLNGFSGYHAYRETLSQNSFVSGYLSLLFLCLGFVFVICIYFNVNGAWTVFGVTGFIMFMIGLRGEVLFPVAVASSLVTLRKKNVIWFLILIMLLMSMVSFVRMHRSDLSFSSSTSIESFNPFNGFAELGSSLRPVYETLKWKYEGDELEYGQTYWAPIERIFSKVIPLIERKDATKDFRLMNVLIMDRAGAYGFSPVAEGVRNFGLYWSCIYFALLALYFNYTTRVKSLDWTVVNIGLYIVLFTNIRNSFAAVPAGMIFIGLMSWLILRILMKNRNV